MSLTAFPGGVFFFFQRELSSSDPIVFPNLKELKLRFSFNHSGKESPTNELDSGSVLLDYPVAVQFPNLQGLWYADSLGRFDFQPAAIPSHMKKVYLGLTGNAFCEFSKLPITSVDGIFVVIFETPDSWPKFHRAAKRLFADIENSGGGTRSIRIFLSAFNWPNQLEECHQTRIGHLDHS